MSDYMFWVDYEVDNELNINHRSRFYITGDMLEDDMSDDDLKEMCLDMIQEDFEELMQPVYDEADNELGQLKDELKQAMEIVKAVAHIALDWGYGKFELDESHIKDARRLYEMYEDK